MHLAYSHKKVFFIYLLFMILPAKGLIYLLTHWLIIKIYTSIFNKTCFKFTLLKTILGCFPHFFFGYIRIIKFCFDRSIKD